MAGGRYRPGQSGNPAGKPRGLKHKRTLLREELLEEHGENLLKRLIQLGLTGDVQALRLVFERLMPARRDRPIVFPLPEIATAGDLPRATAAIVEGAACGEITPSEAEAMMRLLEGHLKAIETHDLAREVAELRVRLTPKSEAS